jgi:hypothetical protein
MHVLIHSHGDDRVGGDSREFWQVCRSSTRSSNTLIARRSSASPMLAATPCTDTHLISSLFTSASIGFTRKVRRCRTTPRPRSPSCEDPRGSCCWASEWLSTPSRDVAALRPCELSPSRLHGRKVHVSLTLISSHVKSVPSGSRTLPRKRDGRVRSQARARPRLDSDWWKSTA